MAVVIKRIERRIFDIQDAAVAGFGNAPEQIKIRFRGGEFRRVIHTRSEHLRSLKLPIFLLQEIDQIRSDLLGRKFSFIMPRAGLLELDADTLTFGADDNTFQIEKVPEIAICIESFHADGPLAAVH